MRATLTSKGQVTVPKEIRDQRRLEAGSTLDFHLQPDGAILVRPVMPDARRLRGLLKSPHRQGLSVEEMDEAVVDHLRDKHPGPAGRLKSARRRSSARLRYSKRATADSPIA